MHRNIWDLFMMFTACVPHVISCVIRQRHFHIKESINGNESICLSLIGKHFIATTQAELAKLMTKQCHFW